MLDIIQGGTKKPVSSQQLTDFFSEQKRRIKYDGFLYIGYPIVATEEGPSPIDALLVSREKGLVVFSLVENKNLPDPEIQDDIYNKLQSKMLAQKSLMIGRKLVTPIHLIVFAPALNTASVSQDNCDVCNINNLENALDGLENWETSSNYYESLVSVIQTTSSIRKGRKKREAQKVDSRGAKLKHLEESIANLDNHQARAVIETVDGVQRIRGLAGSGKTIVLALKAANFHVKNPDWKIAVTFNTRALKGQFRQLIKAFTIEQSGDEPDWNNIQIIHAWGAPGNNDRDGIYYNFCQINGVEYYDFRSAKDKFGQGKEFEGACQKALNESPNSTGFYDVMLVDEAQDFPPAFLRICYELLKPEKRLVYAYDELQNLSSNSLPSPDEIFGKDSNGNIKVRLAQDQDIILKKCYRNSRPVLATAHALGFGIYRAAPEGSQTGLVQIFDDKRLWSDVGYEVTDGDLTDGKEVTLSRTLESSPEFLESHSPIEDLIQFHHFRSKEEQAQWVTDEIHNNIANDELRPDDIMVINPNPLSTRDEVAPIRKQLFQRGINSHLTGADKSPDIFFDTDNQSIAFTGIFRAKGNEAGMVYIINTQDCFSSFGNMARVRNQLFTAITRSKAWVRVIGVGTDMMLLKNEFEKIKQHDFSLQFRYPTVDERKHLNLVNRDMTEDEKQRTRQNLANLDQILEDLTTKKMHLEYFRPDQRDQLKKFLSGKIE